MAEGKITLDPELRPGKNVSALIGQLLILVAILVVAGVSYVAHRRSQRRTQAAGPPAGPRPR